MKLRINLESERIKKETEEGEGEEEIEIEEYVSILEKKKYIKETEKGIEIDIQGEDLNE